MYIQAHQVLVTLRHDFISAVSQAELAVSKAQEVNEEDIRTSFSHW